MPCPNCYPKNPGYEIQLLQATQPVVCKVLTQTTEAQKMHMAAEKFVYSDVSQVSGPFGGSFNCTLGLPCTLTLSAAYTPTRLICEAAGGEVRL